MQEREPARATTPRQRARRDGAIRAALELGAEGGYDAVQMRDVAARADIALGTLYRYFNSKDHLLSSAMTTWIGDLRGRLTVRPPRGETPVDQVVNVLRRATRAFEQQPRLADALMRARSSHESGVAAANLEGGEHFRAILEPLLVDLEPDVRIGLMEVIGQVWGASLSSWINGQFTISQLNDRIDRSVRLVLEPRYELLAVSSGQRSSTTSAI